MHPHVQQNWAPIVVMGVGFVACSLHWAFCFLFFNPSSILFLDPFADATKGDDLVPAGTEDKIHIRIQQRNGRKTLTTVQGIADDYDKKKLVKAFKKVFSA